MVLVTISEEGDIRSIVSQMVRTMENRTIQATGPDPLAIRMATSKGETRGPEGGGN